jgi:hypothetical protein
VSSVTGEEEIPALHRLDDKAVHLRNAFLHDGTLGELPIFVASKPRLEFLPNLFVGPESNIFLGLTLNIQAADLRRAHTQESEAAVMVGVDKFLGRRRDLSENPEPAEWVTPLENGESAGWNGRAGYAVETVAAGDEIASEFFRLTILTEGDTGLQSVEAMNCDIFNFKVNLASRAETSGDKILDDLVLTINRYRLTAGEIREVNSMRAAAESQVYSAMNEAFAPQTISRADFAEQIDRALLEYTGANTLLAILPAARFQDDGLDAVEVKELGKDKAGGPGADDSNLCAHLRTLIRNEAGRQANECDLFRFVPAGFPSRVSGSCAKYV